MGRNGLRIVFVPRHVHARMAIHSMATISGAVVTVRLGWGAPMWADMAWYVGGFIGFHFALAPFMAAWLMLVDRTERWVRGIVEEELIKFDMKGYASQLQGMIPALLQRPESGDP